MHLSKFEIKRLFNLYDHVVDFFFSDIESNKPSVTIIYGPNGAGKTTILRMIEGLMQLNFNMFREVPFSSASLFFNTGDNINVSKDIDDPSSPLLVSFNDLKTRLSPVKKGAFSEADMESEILVVKSFAKATEAISFQFIESSRFLPIYTKEDLEAKYSPREYRGGITGKLPVPKGEGTREVINQLARRVYIFINEAQANYQRFFALQEPNLFSKIIKRLTGVKIPKYSEVTLLKRLAEIRKRELIIERYGLEPDKWNFDEIESIIKKPKPDKGAQYILTVLSAYFEMIESRSAEKMLIANRLLKFENIMNDFYADKKIAINAKTGLEISMLSGEKLNENQLSSGEYHLLYLMVSAVMTRSRGTIIAIDEPELSMHIKWQRKLIRALYECASGAEPQFIFATHSPDISGQYRDYMVPIGGNVE